MLSIMRKVKMRTYSFLNLITNICQDYFKHFPPLAKMNIVLILFRWLYLNILIRFPKNIGLKTLDLLIIRPKKSEPATI